MKNLSPGDRVTIGMTPKINIGNYESLNPHVSVSIEVGDDPDGFQEKIEQAIPQLRAMLERITAEELAHVEKCQNLLGDYADRAAMVRGLAGTVKKKARVSNGKGSAKKRSKAKRSSKAARRRET